MSKRDIYRKLLSNFRLNALSHIFMEKEQFDDWIRKLFFLNDSLKKEYDIIYQDAFWVNLYQLLTEGESYLKKVIEVVNRTNNSHNIKYYNRLQDGLTEIKSKFSDVDFQYLEYRRHNVCHIFQSGYSLFKKDNTVRKVSEQDRRVKGVNKDVSKSLLNIELDFFEVLEKYGGDEGFDKHYREVLFLVIDSLYKDLKQIHLDEINDKD